jgi:integrase
MPKRKYGVGRVEQRGPGRFRLRYSIRGKRYTKTVAAGSKADAQKQLRALLHSGDTGQHVDPSKITLEHWIDQWLQLLKRAPNSDSERKRKRGLVNPRTVERYGQLLDHVKSKLGALALQKLSGSVIDDLYIELEQKLAARTVLHVHNALRPCLSSAVKKKLLVSNPADDAEAPNPGDTGEIAVLGEQELATLVRGFRGHPLEMIVDVAACTGARRNEIIALRWSDIDLNNKTLTIARSVEETTEHGRHLKEPKTVRGRRTIAIDADLAERLRGYQSLMKRLAAGVPDGADVDLALVKLPADALLFPGEKLADLTQLRDGHAVTRTFRRHARKLGFNIKFHWIRASHLTILLDKGEPVHVVAKRAGHDPVTLLRSYARWTKKADAKVAETLASLSQTMV